MTAHIGLINKCQRAPHTPPSVTTTLPRLSNPRILAFLLLGGVPGVIGGSFLLNRLKNGPYENKLYLALGGLIAATALFHLWRIFYPGATQNRRDRSRWLPWFALPIGAEVGFSSAGAGALGSLLLLGLTPLVAAEVVGTDLCFGLGLSAIGSIIQVGAGNYDGMLLVKLVIGGLAGALTGSLLAGRIAQRPLRVGLLLMLVILGFQLAIHGATPQAAASGSAQMVSRLPHEFGNSLR
jgi:uncharacterized protein